MTNYQKEQYKIRYEIENYKCNKTGLRANEMAHRIANTKLNRKNYGKLLDHNFNLVPCTKGNNACWNIGMKPATSKKLIELIIVCGKVLFTVEEINKIIGV